MVGPSRFGTGCVALLDQVVLPQQKRLWDRESERLGSLEVDHQLELCRLRHCGG
jgi:hypothetical protein